MSFRLSLLARIYLATAVAVTTLFAAAGWFFVYQASTALHNGLETEVRASLATVDASLESRTEHLATASALLASMSDIRAAFGSHDSATIRDTASEFWARAEAGHPHVETAAFAVASPDGVVIAAIAKNTPAALSPGRKLADSILTPARRAFPKQSGVFADLGDGLVWQVLVTPLYVDSGATSALLNILIAAHPLTDETLEDLKVRTGGIDFLLHAGGRTTNATLDATKSAVVATHPDRFAIHSTVLRDGEGDALAELLAVRSIEGVEARIRELSRNMIAAWIVAMTAGLVLSYFLARRIVRPIGILNQAALEVAQENFTVRVPEDSQDELGVLARTFNQMSASIQAARDEQIRTGQIMAVGRLAAAIAHDLRNPLSAVVGGSEMLADFDLSQAQMKQIAGHVHKAARRMEHLLEEIGRVARAKPGTKQVCIVEDLIAAAVESQSTRAAELRVEIHQTVEPGLRTMCEPTRIERVLVNLISNALEVLAQSSAGEISIRAWSSDKTVWIEVSDNGPGIPAEIRGKLFQPFVTSGKKDGLGLGLALSRQTLLDHGGDLVLMPSDCGACFRLSLLLG